MRKRQLDLVKRIQEDIAYWARKVQELWRPTPTLRSSARYRIETITPIALPMLPEIIGERIRMRDLLRLWPGVAANAK